MNWMKDRIKIGILLTAILLLAGLRGAMAQNTGSQPYQDSRHAYGVTIGATANTQYWEISNGVSSPIPLSTGTPAWAHYGPATTNGGYDTIQIFFDRSVFAIGSTWYLRYYETDGSNSCVSAREYPIVIDNNTFYLTLADDSDSCNSQDGVVHTTAEVDGISFPSQVGYTITMTKEDDFDPTSWQFDVTFEQAVTSISSQVVTADGGSVVVTEIQPMDQTTYRITVTPNASNLSSVVVTVTVGYSNPVHADVTRAITVTHGEALVSLPPAPVAVTNDNIIEFPLAPATQGDRVQAMIIHAIPATRNIVPGTSETAVSAQHPLQNSTHRYDVEMADYTNNDHHWTIENASGTVMTSGTHYNLTETNSGNTVTAAIEFTGFMALGSYTIYFTEENRTTGCSSVRQYAVTLGDPLNVTIALTSPGDDAARCAQVSGTIVANDDLDVATTTTISYTVTLNTADYDFAWNFHYALTTNVAGGFRADDVEVAGVMVDGVANSTGDVSVAAGVKTATIVVTYQGFYQNQHTITMTLSNIEGSFSDTAAGVHVDNIIYAMPQALALVGVE